MSLRAMDAIALYFTLSMAGSMERSQLQFLPSPSRTIFTAILPVLIVLPSLYPVCLIHSHISTAGV
ncbi:hypothetical protein [Nostoc sp.]|uniref:hypothetical protein n=1 Tax=Nostoc sp. TaxID=1180 RepID=UPI002FF971D5